MTKLKGGTGQILPLFAIAIFAIISAVALVIEGSNLFAQQRVAQNGTDAAAYAGAITIAENLADPGSRTGTDVFNSITAAAAQTVASDADGIQSFVGIYTDGFGVPLAGPVTVTDSGAIPGNARGVNVAGTRLVDATVARVIGFTQFPVNADATAIAGPVNAPCPPDTTCAVLPVTMPVSFGETVCDQDVSTTGLNNQIEATWTTIDDPDDATQTIPANMSVLPLCITGSGDFSWLDLGPDNLQQEILNPSGQSFVVPDWLRTQPGNPNSADTEINAYRGKIVLIPMWQDICGSYPGSPSTPCSDPSFGGNNTWYNIPYMRPLLLEGAYTQGDNRTDCSVPGVTWPPESGSGSVPGLIGCLKGWFLDQEITGGPIDLSNDPIDPNAAIGVQLIK